MKRLWVSLVLLALIFAATLWNARHLTGFTQQVSSLLAEAGICGESGDWDRALELTEEARDLWESRESYLYITLIHSDTDKIHVGFRETLEFIRRREDGEYSAANARLMAQLYLLREMDQFTIRNIL